MADQVARAVVQPTLLGLINAYGHVPAESIRSLVQVGASAQRQLHREGLSRHTALTRTTALWAIIHLEREIALTLSPSRVSEEGLRRQLKLSSVPPPSAVNDVAVHDDLARALRTALATDGHRGTLDPLGPTELVDIAIAILRDVDAKGGLLGKRLLRLGASVTQAIADLERQRSAALAAIDQPGASRRAAPGGSPAISSAAGLYLGFYEALRERRRPSANANAIDRGALWPAFGLVATRRGDTSATVVVRVLLELRGDRGSPSDLSDGLRAFDISGEVHPVPIERIDVASHPLVALAGVVRDRVEPGNYVCLRHLVAVVLEQGSGPRRPETRDRDVEAIRTRFLEQIRRNAEPVVGDAWQAYFTELADGQRPPSTSAETDDGPAPTGRAVAGIDVDMVDDSTKLSDELGVVGDVVTLCDMLAAREAVPPISVGLFGRWGGGKSYFMALMRRRIEELGNAAKAAKERGDPTSYCAEVVQVTFNAWHYMDADDLWATLAVHLFGAIAQLDPDDDRARPRADVVRDLERRKRQMETVDRRITRALGDGRLDEAAARMGLEAPREEVLGLVREIGTTVGYAAAVKVLLTRTWTEWTRWRRWSAVGLAMGLVALVALGALMIAGTVPTGWLLAWVPLAVTVGGAAVRWLGRIKAGLAQVNRVAAESGLQPRDLTAERIDNDAQVRSLLTELEAIDRLTDMREWVRQRALSSDYTSRLGVISVLRGDLEALVEKQRRDTPDRRIILYIDDLDRCPPSRVVEVLQAVHLLLAFPLFVVVVGVDPRWLLRSLERHYRQVLSTSDGGPRTVDDLLTETTPHDYLEKIFQIPFSLRRMDADGYGRLVASLAGRPADGSAATADADVGAALPESLTAGTAPDAVVPMESTERATADQPASHRATVGQATSERAADRQASVGQAAIDNGSPDLRGAGEGVDSLTTTGAAPEPDDGATAMDPAAPEAELPLAPVAVNPPQLRITEGEVAALADMGPLIGTPRAAKRLVNLYRLIRAGLSDADVERLVTDAQYRPLAIMLAAQVGFPRVASTFLTELVAGEAHLPLTERLVSLPPPDPVDDGGDRQADWESLRTALRAVCVDEEGQARPELDRPLAELAAWIPRIRRYSFEGALGSL